MTRFLYLKFLNRWYNLLSTIDATGTTILMNYGYEDGHPLSVPAKDQHNRTRLQLYHRVASGTEVKNKHVLEVGSGRGGGAEFVTKYHKPKKYDAIDFSAKAIEFCKKRYAKVRNLQFTEGNAMDIPFADGVFDAVINVESSHGYPNEAAFYAEVHRVLVPRGYFLYTDFRPSGDVDSWKSLLKKSGFVIRKQEKINRQVVTALDIDHEYKTKLIARHVPFGLRTLFSLFAGVKGSSIYNQFVRESLEYWNFVLQKRA